MTSRAFSLLSYPVVTVLLIALTLALILLGRYWGLGLSALFLLAVPIALAVAYFSWYRTLPYEPSRPRPAAGPPPVDEEPFEDPVEEADRYDDMSEDDTTPEEPTDVDEPEELPSQPPASP